jgi:hypothetical protein
MTTVKRENLPSVSGGMMSKRQHWSGVLLLILLGGHGVEAQRGRGNPTVPPEIEGGWSGTWSTWNPAQGAVPAKEICKELTANVVRKDTIWEATFEGDCGRPYKYTIKMEGRFIGGVVLFKGTVDLGPQDGGVFDWIGRATNNEFVGFFTSGFYTGIFNLARKK